LIFLRRFVSFIVSVSRKVSDIRVAQQNLVKNVCGKILRKPVKWFKKMFIY